MRDPHLIQAREREKKILQEFQNLLNMVFDRFVEDNKKPEIIFLCTDEEGVHLIPENDDLKSELFVYTKELEGKPASIFELDKFPNYKFFSNGEGILDQLDNVYPFIKMDKEFFDSQLSLMYHGTLIGSYIEEVINVCLITCDDWLSNDRRNNVYYKNILKEAGNNLISKALNFFNFSIEGYQFIEDCIAISTMKYEGTVAKGTLYLQSTKSNSDIKFANQLSLKNYRLVRKMLEISNENKGLTSDGSYIYGIKEISEKDIDDTIMVRFTNHFEFNILFSGKPILKYRDGFPYLVDNEFDETLIKSAIKDVFNKMSNVEINNLIKIIKESRKQKHGTMMLVSKDAKSEAERLSGQAIIIDPKVINGSWIESLTSIDGAVIIDEQCKCYAIGAILDGKAGQIGTPTRGARYNSALKYHNEHLNRCIIVVISEDGMVDIIN